MRFSAKLMTVAALAAITLISVSARADEASAVPPPTLVVEEPNPTSGYEKGFFIQNPDKSFRLVFNGKVDLQHLFEDFETKQNTNSFRLRRGQFKVSGKFLEKLGFELVTTYSSKNCTAPDTLCNQVPTWEARGMYDILPTMVLTFGHVGLPMDRGNVVLTEAPLTATQEDGKQDLTITRPSFGLPNDIGLVLEGSLGKFDYAAGLGNGSGRYVMNANNEFTYSGRLQYNILENPGAGSDYAWTEKAALAVGAGAGFEDEDAVDGDKVKTNLLWSLSGSGDVMFKWHGLTLYAEVYGRKLRTAKSGTLYSTLDDLGYVGQASYFVLPRKVEVMGEFARIHREGPDNDSISFGGGAKWYILKENLTLQGDYTNVLDYDNIAGTNDETIHRIRTMLTAKF